MIDYRLLVKDKEAIKTLYKANEWTHYIDDLTKLMNAFDHSLDALGAYDGDKLVGLVRVVGDGNTIIYVQDILVLPDYQRQGIGRTLMTRILGKYSDVRQIVLTTDNTDKQKGFYESLGFKQYTDLNLVGYYYIKK